MTSVGGTLSAGGTPRSTGSRMGRPSKSCQACKDDHAKCDGSRACCERNPNAHPEGSQCPNHDPIARKEVEEQMERIKRLEEELRAKEQTQATSMGVGEKKTAQEMAGTVPAAPQATNIPITSVPVPLLKRPLPTMDLNVMAKRPARPATFLPATPDTRGVPASPRPSGPPAQLPFPAPGRMPQMMERELENLRAKVRQLEEEKIILEQKLTLTRKGSAGLCCRIKPYDLQVPQGKMVVRRRVAQRVMDLWKEHGYYDIEIKSIEVLPAGMTQSLHLELKDPNEEERKVYWQQQMDKRAAGEIETAGMEVEDDDDQYSKHRTTLLGDATAFDAVANAHETFTTEVEKDKVDEMGAVQATAGDATRLPAVPISVPGVTDLAAGDPSLLVDLSLPPAPLMVVEPTAAAAAAAAVAIVGEMAAAEAAKQAAVAEEPVVEAVVEAGVKRANPEDEGDQEDADDEAAKKQKTQETTNASGKPDAAETQQAAKIIAGMGSRTTRSGKR